MSAVAIARLQGAFLVANGLNRWFICPASRLSSERRPTSGWSGLSVGSF
ncbi:UNVERIFIED_ORG: hypothetical protein J2X79_004519 [Arthrobacter globiformis]|nr:hypothetical protein [Arthrobacter globiformis]